VMTGRMLGEREAAEAQPIPAVGPPQSLALGTGSILKPSMPSFGQSGMADGAVVALQWVPGTWQDRECDIASRMLRDTAGHGPPVSRTRFELLRL
jgi:hypothetical protein